MTPLHFAQIREDSWIERELADARSPKRVVVIASGGCTALSLLDDHVEEVIAVDSSLAQCALVELRRAAIFALDREAYLAFVGETPCADRPAIWDRIEENLPTYARDYWNGHREVIACGVQHAGTTERYYRFVASHLRSLIGDGPLRALLDAPSVDAQRVIFDRSLKTDAARAVLRVLLAKSTHLLFFPAFMFEKAAEDDFADFFMGQLENEAQTRAFEGNYFLSQFLFGRYVHSHPRGMPPYLTSAGYASAQRNVGKLRVRAASLHGALEKTRGVDAFFLSNVFDWCSADTMEMTCRRIVDAANPGATLLYRNMLSESALSSAFRSHFTLEDDLSSRLHAQDRSVLYRRLSVGRIR